MSQWQPHDPRRQAWQSPATPPQWGGQPQYPSQQQSYGYQQPQAYPPPVQVNVQQNVRGPRKAITQGKLGYGEELFHWCMIICSCGLWYPIYASRKRSKRTVTRYR